jgi:hypothetical protein
MADPVATHSYEARVGRALRALDYRWFEEPFYDYDVQSYIKLQQKLDIPIAGTETITGGALLGWHGTVHRQHGRHHCAPMHPGAAASLALKVAAARGRSA